MHTLHLRINSQPQSVPHFIGRGLWQELIDFLTQHFAASAIYVITDSHLFRLYGTDLSMHLSKHPGFKEILTIPPGEASKSRKQKSILEDALLQTHAGRDSLLVAFGGGVVGDLSGLVAATLYRGIPYIQIPTSLIAQADSSIGGKVGINHSTGKNLLGAFYHPRAVFTDINFLTTLSDEEFVNGMAEVIKYAVTLDEELWNMLENNVEAILRKDPPVLEGMITRCQEIKIRVVEQDERETRYRSVLNFGHTVGHALEQLSNYQIKHGVAVAAGMQVAARLSHRLLGYPTEMVARLEQLLSHFNLLQVNPAEYPIEELWGAILSDKKVRLQKPHFTLLTSPQQPRLFYPIEKGTLYDVIQET